MNKVRLRIFQMDIRSAPAENLSAVSNAAGAKWRQQNILGEGKSTQSSAAEKDAKCDVLLLPELFTTGYHGSAKMKSLAEDIDGNTVTTLKRIAREREICIGCGSFIENDDGKILNTSIAINKKGQLKNRYRKTHLFTVMGEEKIFQPGYRLETFMCNGISIGTVICYEIRFPELARKHALSGARIIFCPAQWPQPKGDILFTLARARAIENQLFFVVANRVGIQGKYEFCGKSGVFAPDGEVIALGSETEEEIIDVEIDLDYVEKYRNDIPAMKERRP
jgi:predicted amidohydrolase